MPGFIGVPELIVLAIVLLLIFGPKRLPEIGKSMGKGMREFKESVSGMTGDSEPAAAKPELPAAPAATTDPHA
jgi:sec-independent protein translocase protein TatA